MIPIDYNNPNDPWMNTGYDPFKGMDDKDRMLAGCMQGVTFLIMIVVALLLCLLFSGCTTTKYVPVPEYHTDTLRQVTVRHDSVMVRDSIHITEKGDTVRIERWHTLWRDRLRVDTIYQATHDTIPQPYPIETIKMVEKELSWWQRLRLWIGNIILIAILGVIGYYGVKLWRVYKFF